MGTDKNLEIGDFSIYHLAGFSGVLLNPSKGAEEPGPTSLFGNVIDDKYV